MKNQPERLLARGRALTTVRQWDRPTKTWPEPSITRALAMQAVHNCYRRTQLSRAIAFLGDRWRGTADCRHVYNNAAGERIDLDRKGKRDG